MAHAGRSQKLTPGQLITVARRAGFSPNRTTAGYPQDVLFAAIALGESSGDVFAHNDNAATGDNSYGLWQINMLGSLGPARRKQFDLKNNEQLWHPDTNAKAAYAISNKGRNPLPWSAFTSGSYARFIGTAQKGAANPEAAEMELDPNAARDAIDRWGSSNPFEELFSDWGLRAAYFIGGGVAIVVALLVLTGRSSTVRDAVKQLPMGRVAKAVT